MKWLKKTPSVTLFIYIYLYKKNFLTVFGKRYLTLLMKAYSYSAYLTKVKETLNQLSASAQQQFYRRCPIKNKTAGVNTTLPSCDQFRSIHIPYIYTHIYNTPYISPPHTDTPATKST